MAGSTAWRLPQRLFPLAPWRPLTPGSPAIRPKKAGQVEAPSVGERRGTRSVNQRTERTGGRPRGRALGAQARAQPAATAAAMSARPRCRSPAVMSSAEPPPRRPIPAHRRPPRLQPRRGVPAPAHVRPSSGCRGPRQPPDDAQGRGGRHRSATPPRPRPPRRGCARGLRTDGGGGAWGGRAEAPHRQVPASSLSAESWPALPAAPGRSPSAAGARCAAIGPGAGPRAPGMTR